VGFSRKAIHASWARKLGRSEAQLIIRARIHPTRTMDFFQTLIVALVPGITKFLPISSSAHPILVPESTAWENQGLAFDAAVHGGSLLLILVWNAIGRGASPA